MKNHISLSSDLCSHLTFALFLVHSGTYLFHTLVDHVTERELKLHFKLQLIRSLNYAITNDSK